MNVKCMLNEINCPYCDSVATLRKNKVNSGFRSNRTVFPRGTEFTYEHLCYTCDECSESFTTNEIDTITLDNYNKSRRSYKRKNKINEYFR